MSPKTVVVLDYGSGNIRSAERAVARAGVEVIVTADGEKALAADGLVVPGVGAFAACMDGLRAAGGDGIVAERVARGLPTLAICVGHQVLFAGIEDERFYFVHSYAVRELAESEGRRVTWAEHGGDRFVAAVEDGPLWSTQFHPEKSGDAGARLIGNWVATL